MHAETRDRAEMLRLKPAYSAEMVEFACTPFPLPFPPPPRPTPADNFKLHPPVLLLTVEKMMTCFSRPWKPSTLDTWSQSERKE